MRKPTKSPGSNKAYQTPRSAHHLRYANVLFRKDCWITGRSIREEKDPVMGRHEPCLLANLSIDILCNVGVVTPFCARCSA